MCGILRVEHRISDCVFVMCIKKFSGQRIGWKCGKREVRVVGSSKDQKFSFEKKCGLKKIFKKFFFSKNPIFEKKNFIKKIFNKKISEKFFFSPIKNQFFWAKPIFRQKYGSKTTKNPEKQLKTDFFKFKGNLEVQVHVRSDRPIGLKI